MNDTLLITPQLCKEYKSCTEGLQFLERFYPDGFTVEDVYLKKIKHVPRSFVDWGYQHLPFTSEDKKRYLEYSNIVNSESFFNCFNITNCSVISDSKFVTDSSHVSNSSQVNKSVQIYTSDDINSSKQVVQSKHINNSTHIFYADNIIDSNFIGHAADVHNSHGIVLSRSVSDSYYLINCEDAQECFVSTNLTRCKNKIFCTDLKDNDEFMLMNKPISEPVFEFIKQELIILLKEQRFQVTNNDNLEVGMIGDIVPNLPRVHPKVVLFVIALNDVSFWQVIKDIVPDFNLQFLYTLTFCSKIFDVI